MSLPQKTDLSTATRNSIVQYLLENSKNGKPAYGKIEEAITKYSSSRRTISRLWAEARKQRERNEPMNSISKKKDRSSTPTVRLDLECIQRLPLSKRSTIRSLACGINQARSTVGRWASKGMIISHSNAIKPALTASNKLLRLKFSLQALKYDTMLNKVQFQPMFNVVHIDEKWFYITKASQRYYLAPGEEEPYRTCKSKNYIGKVMFLSAVARPIYHTDGTLLFDGKIGIFPFTEMVPAKRNSKNRIAGTMEQKPIQSINMQVMKNAFINQIVPTIKSLWPEGASKQIYIQQDNARPHIKDSDPDFRAAASSDGFDIRIVHQPPNSPDMNINDLGWFRSIQSIQHETVCLNTDDLVNVVKASFQTQDAYKLNKVFLTLQACMLEVMKSKGHNAYRIPHLKKDAQARNDMIPLILDVPTDLVKECIDHLIEHGEVDGIDELMQQLGLNQSAGA